MQGKKSAQACRLYWTMHQTISDVMPGSAVCSRHVSAGLGSVARSRASAGRVPGRRDGRTADLRMLPNLACRSVDVRCGAIIRPALENDASFPAGRRAHDKARRGEPGGSAQTGRVDARRPAAAWSPAGRYPQPWRFGPSPRRHPRPWAPWSDRREPSSRGCGASPSTGGASSIGGWA